ncbi:MAG TPA: PAS domain-containing protein, partial [Rubrivivax sp.]|nr:PAS domain-containing protein [Rubrivivax sp.]
GLVQVTGLSIIDADGRVRASSSAFPLAADRTGLADVPAFQQLRSQPAQAMMVAPAMQGVSQRDSWIIPMGRPLQTAGGAFAGAVAAGGRVDYYQNFYRDVRLPGDTMIALAHRDGTLLVRHPPADAPTMGRRFERPAGIAAAPGPDAAAAQTGAAAGAAPARDAAQGLLRYRSPIDGIERFGALKPVAGYPLMVMVSRDVSQAMAPWRAEALRTALRTLALGVMATVLLVLVHRQFGRLEGARVSLERSRERFALAAAGSGEGIWEWDVASDRIYASARTREILGLPPGPELQARQQWVAAVRLHAADRARWRAALDAHLEGGAPVFDGEYRVRHADGQFRWMSMRGLCVRDAQGRPLRMAGSVTDIDARRRAEDALRLSEERLALAMTGSTGGHWVWERGTDALFVSGNLAAVFGLPADAPLATQRELREQVHFHPDDEPRLQQMQRDIDDPAVPRIDYEYRILLPGSGEVRWILTRAQCFRDEHGRAQRVAGVSLDISTRKRIEEALRLSEERYALAVAGSDDGVWDFDYVRNRVFGSRRCREILGLPLEPEVQSFDEWFGSIRLHPDDAAERLTRMQAHLDGCTPAYEGEWRVRWADGGWRLLDYSGASGGCRWVRVRGVCVRDASGKPLRMAGSVSDIDARKRAEQALRDSEERYALALAGSNDGIIDWDLERDRMFASARAWRLIGLAPQEGMLTREQWAPLVMPRFHPDDVVRVIAELHGTGGSTPEAHEGEYLMLGADGEYHWMRFRGRLTRDAQGAPLRWAGSVSDIDVLKKTEQALRRSEERYQLAVDGSNEGLWDWDLDSDTLFLSPRAQDLVGQPGGDAQRPRREWLALLAPHPDDRAPVRQALATHLRGQSKRFKAEFRLQRPDGQWHWYRQRGVSVRDAEGLPLRMAGSLEDITDRKRDEAERERLELQLRQAQKLEAIGTLAGGIAHDFNNILAAILGYGELAQKDAAPGSALRRHIDAAVSAGLRAKSLVERILAFSRSGMGERVPVHVQSVVAEALDAVAASLPVPIRLDRRLEAGDAAVLGDATQVHQVVMNLCANAVQAMKAGGTLRVTLDRAKLESPRCATRTLPGGSYLRLRVADTGSGIPAELLERIFDPFFTTKEVGVGTGLGLSLVHGIVADLGGGIDVDSVPGQGSAFTIYLPWQSCVAAPAGAEPRARQGNGQTVLLVDDEEPLVLLGEELIAGLGYEPIGFTSSVAALQSLRDAPARYDLVLSDEAMPEMTGSELARAIRAIRADIPIVLMSGCVTAALTRRARDAGVTEVLAKPLVANDIARSLADALQPPP